MKIDPDKLTDEEFAKRWSELKFAIKFESNIKNPFG